MKRQYNRESVQRALDIRQDEGQISSWRWDEASRTFTVQVFDYGTFEGSIPATHGLVVGMRAMQVWEQKTEKAV